MYICVLLDDQLWNRYVVQTYVLYTAVCKKKEELLEMNLKTVPVTSKK